jgi:Fic family protein
MDTSTFTEKRTGRLLPTIEGQISFLPHPLPPNLDLAALAIPLGNAMEMIGELRGACRRLQNPYMVIGPLQRREALMSSAMEGTYTTTDALVLLEAGAVSSAADESAREVFNYVRALKQSVEALKELPISHRIIKQAHRTLLSGLSSQRGAAKRPGDYKIEQNWIGGRTIDQARYVPPPPQQAQACMDELERYINREDVSFPPALIDLALVHYQFEAIHPFADGNGRVGRILIPLMAIQNGLLSVPVLYLSPYLETRRDEYIDLMFNVSSNGDWIPWINFFFETIIESCKQTIRIIDDLIALQEKYRGLAKSAGRSSNLISVVDRLFERASTTIPLTQNQLGVTYRAAQLMLEKLVEVGILREIESYPKIFFAPEVAAVSRPTVQRPRGSTEPPS